MQSWTVKPATGRQLAEVYKLPYRVFLRHLKEIKHIIGKRIGYFYTVKQIIAIIEYLGPPPCKEVIYTRM